MSLLAVVQALKQERARRVLQGAPAGVITESEEAIVAFFVEGCRFEMQSGHTERAIASIQAALEYACFAPSFPVGMLCFVLCCAVLCYAILCHAVLRYAMLCCAVHVQLW